MRDMEYELEPIQVQDVLEKPIPPVPTRPNDGGPEHADVVYFFPEGSTTGVKVYLQCPKEALEHGKLVVSKMELVEYDENIHGQKDEWQLRRVKDGDSFGELTRVVSPEDYVKIALQGIIQTHPEDQNQQHYFVVDLKEATEKSADRIDSILNNPEVDYPNREICAHVLGEHTSTIISLTQQRRELEKTVVIPSVPNFNDEQHSIYDNQVDLNINLYNDTFEKDVFIKETNNGDEPKGPKL